jgi:predicted nucleic acid-binding protein
MIRGRARAGDRGGGAAIRRSDLEIRRDILELRAGSRRRALERWFAGPEGRPSLFAGRVLPLDIAAAIVWGRLMAEGTASGRPRSALDMIIAANAKANDCMVATANERDFPASSSSIRRGFWNEHRSGPTAP